MSQYRLFALAVIGLLVIGFVRMLEQPDAPDDVMGSLFRTDSVGMNPTVRAACAAIHQPLEELLGQAIAQASLSPDSEGPEGRCRMEGGVTDPGDRPPEMQLVEALFHAMQWEALDSSAAAARSFRRDPVSCHVDIVSRDSIRLIGIECGFLRDRAIIDGSDNI